MCLSWTREKSIDIHDWRNRDSTLAALAAIGAEVGSFTVTGNDEYKAMCAKLAAEHGFKITNPELQGAHPAGAAADTAGEGAGDEIGAAKAVRAVRGSGRRGALPGNVHQDAGRRRKQTFILDKKDGITRGFTPQEIEQRTPEMLRLQRRGRKPLLHAAIGQEASHPHRRHEPGEAGRFIRDGYRPAVVLESSPGNYQAIITVPKLGTAHDKDVGNRLSDALNREYGDPKLSGAIHPHRAPGYENRKPKHQREDGSYPEVRLLKAERRECVKALALSSQIDAEYQRQAALKAQQPERSKAKARLGACSGQRQRDRRYQRHYRDVIKRQRGGEVDLSRVDSMIAVRMRVTGHDQAAIEGAIRQCAPATRQKDEGATGTTTRSAPPAMPTAPQATGKPPSLGSTASSGRSWKGASLYASRSRPRRRRSSATTHPA